MSDTSDLARALGRIPSGLFVVTAGKDSETTGFLASFVQQLGFEPPVLGIAVKPGRPAAKLIAEHGAFSVAVVDQACKHLIGHFSRGFEPGTPAFEGIACGSSESGVPYPSDALAVLHCKLVGEGCWSDHLLFVGEVVAGICRDQSSGDLADPMIHLRKNGFGY